MSRLSVRGPKSTAVSIAGVPDQIQTFLKWSLVPIAALIAVGFISPARPASFDEYCRMKMAAQAVSRSVGTLGQCQ